MKVTMRTQLNEENSYETFVEPRESTKLWMGWSIATQVRSQIKHAVSASWRSDAEDPVEANGWVY